eukprot:TRINITY_DN57551_c0_g1_i1.p1 TRINITY_DN57551_c0_g1~~TRINITY_DN57551_c0_g1_i1.p1  ORF type:complete len:855 (+),score=65.04 TRINITY_DN57551_c0_g1_i1:27-2591(+)
MDSCGEGCAETWACLGCSGTPSCEVPQVCAIVGLFITLFLLCVVNSSTEWIFWKTPAGWKHSGLWRQCTPEGCHANIWEPCGNPADGVRGSQAFLFLGTIACFGSIYFCFRALHHNEQKWRRRYFRYAWWLCGFTCICAVVTFAVYLGISRRKKLCGDVLVSYCGETPDGQSDCTYGAALWLCAGVAVLTFLLMLVLYWYRNSMRSTMVGFCICNPQNNMLLPGHQPVDDATAFSAHLQTDSPPQPPTHMHMAASRMSSPEKDSEIGDTYLVQLGRAFDNAIAPNSYSNRLNIAQLKDVCSQIYQYPITEDVIREKLAEGKYKGSLGREDFVHFCNILERAPSLLPVWQQNTTSPYRHTVMTIPELATFKRVEQRERATEPEISTQLGRIGLGHNQFINIDQFNRLITSTVLNPWHDPSATTMSHQDMSRPLCHYYINASVGTYYNNDLTVYKEALLGGCRYVELQCWSHNGDIIVAKGVNENLNHPRMKFVDVIATINNYAFTNSMFPVIVSLEVHCSSSHQDQMANILMSTFSEKLVPQCTMDLTSPQFTPQALGYKILLATKVSSEGMPTEAISGELDNLIFLYGSDAENNMFNAGDKTNCSLTHFVDDGHFTPDLAFAQLNTRSFSLVTKKDALTASQNPNAVDMWILGAQLVGFNWNVRDAYFNQMQALFRCNGNCGYYLKPRCVLHSPHYPPPYDSTVLNMKILSTHATPPLSTTKLGVSLPTKNYDVYALVSIEGHGNDKGKQQYSTVHKDSSGWHIIWNDTLTLTIDHPEVAMLTISVFCRSSQTEDQPLCCASVPFPQLKPGYRAVPLVPTGPHQYNRQPVGQSYMLCHFLVQKSRLHLDASVPQ